MTMRTLFPVLLAALLVSCSKRESSGSNTAQLPTGSPAVAFRITLGATDSEPARWDGSIDVSGGKLMSLSGWRFYKDDAIGADGKSWKCATRRRATHEPKNWWVGAKHIPPADLAAPAPQGAMIPNGVIAVCDARPTTEIRVSTASGNFSFSPDSAPLGKPASFLGGRAVVERVIAPWNLTASDGLEDDNPAVVIDADGRAWAAWIGYAKGQDQVYAAPFGQKPMPVGKPGVFFRTALARHSERDLWLVACAREGETWNLVGSRWDGRGRSEERRVGKECRL